MLCQPHTHTHTHYHRDLLQRPSPFWHHSFFLSAKSFPELVNTRVIFPINRKTKPPSLSGLLLCCLHFRLPDWYSLAMSSLASPCSLQLPPSTGILWVPGDFHLAPPRCPTWRAVPHPPRVQEPALVTLFTCHLTSNPSANPTSVFFPLKKLIFSWKVITLQYCVGFCHTSTWIRHRYTHAPSLLNLSPPTHPFPHPPLSVATEHWI